MRSTPVSQSVLLQHWIITLLLSHQLLKMSEDNDLRSLILTMKAEILNKIETRNAETEKNIEASIQSIKQDVKSNKDEISKLNKRLDDMERENAKATDGSSYADALKKEVDKTYFLQEARKIIGIMPINNADIERNRSESMSDTDALVAAVDEFLKLELKMDSREIQELQIKDITRPKKDDPDRVYLHFDNEEGPQYIFRKNIHVQNEEIKVAPFVPPQIFKRFAELSRLTFIARREDPNLKTQIRYGDNDLILLTRMKEEKEWTDTSLEKFGKLPEMELQKSWPLKKMPIITSPPKGREKREKNVHDLSRSSNEEETPRPKKKKNKTLGGVSDLQNYFEKRDNLKNRKNSKS